MNNAYTGFNTRMTPQTEPIPGENQIQNNAGGYVYDVGAFKRFERFLLLGSEGGTYYVGEDKLTRENALNTIAVIESDGIGAVRAIVEISESGRAVKNDPAIFALALACSAKSPATRSAALNSLPRVCRIPTHLFHFLTYVLQFRGFGRGLKRAVGDWYQNQEVGKLAYQVVKYQSRDGWSNADALRLAHPKTGDPVRNFVYRWIVDGFEEAKAKSPDYGITIPEIISGFEHAKTGDNLPYLIKAYNLSREMLPTEALNKKEVWEALLERMPMTAMIRNLGNMSKVGLLTTLSASEKRVCEAIVDRENLKKARVHPISILTALKTYSKGHGLRGSGQWDVSARVVDALNEAFYAAFDYVEPSGKSILIGIDVSGSMNAGISKLDMSAKEGAAAMALAIARTESEYGLVLFDTEVVKAPVLSKRTSLQEIEKMLYSGGGTDCASVIRWATQKKVKADAIIILTDNETWAGKWGQPVQWMRKYRETVNSQAKIVNVAMTATSCTINDPKDDKELSVAGFDSSVPQVITNFLKES